MRIRQWYSREAERLPPVKKEELPCVTKLPVTFLQSDVMQFTVHLPHLIMWLELKVQSSEAMQLLLLPGSPIALFLKAQSTRRLECLAFWFAHRCNGPSTLAGATTLLCNCANQFVSGSPCVWTAGLCLARTPECGLCKLCCGTKFRRSVAGPEHSYRAHLPTKTNVIVILTPTISKATHTEVMF
jgi:hypothetical protein